MSKDENTPIQKILLNNRNDNKILKQEIINHIYSFPEKKIIVINDIHFSDNFLIYIDKIEHATIDENSDEYLRYMDISKSQITNELFST